MLKKPKDRGVWECKLLEEIDQRCDPFRSFHTMAARFLLLMRTPKEKGSAAGFAKWMEDVLHGPVPEMRRFGEGLEQDRSAVEAAMALPWSNGPVEGAVIRLKTIKRLINIRASFAWLRKRFPAPGWAGGHRTGGPRRGFSWSRMMRQDYHSHKRYANSTRAVLE